MSLEDRIILPPIKIIGEDKGGYRVLYNNQEVYIAKANSSGFSLGGLGCNQKMSLQLSLVPEIEITQDSDIPQKFILTMMFHELREKEYVESEINNPHERALNDEVLFVLKNLNPLERDSYFEFADNYRKRVFEKLRKKEESEEQNNIQKRIQKKIIDEDIAGYFSIYQGKRLVCDKSRVRRRILICTNEETAERINELTEEDKSMGRDGIVHYKGGISKPGVYRHLNNLKKSSSKFFEDLILITGSKELNDYLISQGVCETRLYTPLEDPKPFNKLKEIVDE